MDVAILNHFEHIHPNQTALKKHHFLMLQGVSSPFFSKLAQCLIDCGHTVHKISFNAGDLVYSSSLSRRWFRQSLEQLPAFLADIYLRFSITDQILFGDRRPIHTLAINHARQFCIKNHVFEEGYFRPFWITLEREGVNQRSLLPRSSAWYEQAAEYLAIQAQEPRRFTSPFIMRAWHDVRYHFAGLVNPVLFPHYKTHSNVNAALEYAGYLRRFPKLWLSSRKDNEFVNRLISHPNRYYLLPLQLNSDAQVRDHQTLNSMPIFIEYVVRSFTRFAPQDAMLVIKNHPLDIGLSHYNALVKTLVQKFNLKDRLKFIETGDLQALAKHAQGVVTLNSTVGMVSLEAGCPTIALGDAIYNFSGLTAQTSLNDFWSDRTLPDTDLYKKFKAVVLQTSQVNGGFYCSQGISMAVHASVDILTAEQSPLEKLLQRISS